MRGCKYNCIISSIVPENMIDSLNKLYVANELTIKVNDRQWFHVFNREHCLTLKELLDFRKDGFIEMQNGQIALLMSKIIEKFISNLAYDVVHGNLTFDNVWIINNKGFWPHNQKHNYEIIFVNYKGGPSDNEKMKEILLTLNEIILPKEKQRILDLFMGNKDQFKDGLTKLATNMQERVLKETQQLASQGWGFSKTSEISIYNKFKQFADPNVFTAYLPLNDYLKQSKLEQSLSQKYLDECRNIIIDLIVTGNNDTNSDSDRITKDIETKLSKHAKQRKDQKIELLIKHFTPKVEKGIQDFIDKSISEFEQVFKLNCNKCIKENQKEYIENCLISIQDNCFEFNSDLAKQIEIIKPIFDRELLNTQKQILKDHEDLFIIEVELLIQSLI